jgi:hypothetical protein
VFAGGLKDGIEHLSNLLGSAFPSDFLNLQFEQVFLAPLSPSVEVRHLGKARRENLRSIGQVRQRGAASARPCPGTRIGILRFGDRFGTLPDVSPRVIAEPLGVGSPGLCGSGASLNHHLGLGVASAARTYRLI